MLLRTLVPLGALVLVTGCAQGSTGPSTSTLPTTNGPTASGVVSASVRGGPLGIAVRDGRTWVTLLDEKAVLTPSGMRMPLGGIPLRITDSAGGLWVSLFDTGEVVNLDADGKVRMRVSLGDGAEPEGLAAVGSQLWVVDQAGSRVVLLDARTGKKLDEVPVPAGPRLAAVGSSDLWVTSYEDGAVTGIDLRTRRIDVSRDAVCKGPQGIAEAGSRVYVACTVDDSVVVLDPTTLEELTGYRLQYADAVAVGGSTVYVVGQKGPGVLALDAATSDVVAAGTLDDTDPVSRSNVAAVVAPEGLVVTHPEAGEVFTAPVPLSTD
jgi:sugar lactone lactonase YvrE